MLFVWLPRFTFIFTLFDLAFNVAFLDLLSVYSEIYNKLDIQFSSLVKIGRSWNIKSKPNAIVNTFDDLVFCSSK